MKAKLTTALVLASCVFLAVAVFAAATARATQVTATSAVTADKIAETNPDLSGSNLVWQELNGNDWNVYYGAGLAGTLPGKVTALIAPGDQVLPRVSETDPGQPDNHVLVVWEDHRNGDADIDGYDMTTDKPLAICTNAAQQVAPRISGDWVVWQDNRNGNWDIYGATIDPATDTVSVATPICDESHDQIEPDVSGDTVVWVDKRYGDEDIMGYVDGYTFPICLNDAFQDQPAIAGNTVVWRDARNAATSGADIYGYDLLTSREFPVCTAPGDQSSPAVDQDLVVWNDARSATSGLDVRGFDLSLQQPFKVVGLPASQSQPTISDYRVVWTDKRNGPVADLWTATLTPWNARLTIDGGTAWTRNKNASLKLFAQGKTGVVTQMTLANVAAGAPVGKPEPYWSSKSPWYLTSGDGLKTVSVTYAALSGAPSPTIFASITLDTHGPTIRVPAAVTVTKGTTAAIGYRVTDNLAPRAAVAIRVLNAKGEVVKVFVVGKAATGVFHEVKFVCELPVGSYTVHATATDLAGNKQTKLGTNTLTVK
jgi:beta propeller repeat protein